MKKKTALFLTAAIVGCLSGIPTALSGQTAPDSVFRASLSQAMRKIAQNSYPSAIYNLKECIETMPDNPVPYYQLATVYATLEDGNQAVYYARKAFSLAPQNAWYQEYLLSLALKYKKAEAVQAVLEQRLTGDPSVLADLLNAYAYTRSWDKALSLIDKHEKQHGADPALKEARKDIYLKSGNYKAALNCLKALQKTSPDNPHYAVERTLAMAGVGDTAGSWKYLEAFQRAHPRDGYVAYTLLSHYQEIGDPDRMFESLQVVAADTVFSGQDKAKVLDKISSFVKEHPAYRPQFEKALEQVLALSPEDPLVCAYASDYYYGQGREQEGFELLRKAIRGGFGDRTAVLRLLYAEAQANDFPALQRDAQRVLEGIGEDPEVYFLYGYATHLLGDPAQAIPALERGKRMAREGALSLYVEICSLLGSLYHETGDEARSAENFELVLAIDPDNAGALNNYGYFMACAGGDLSRARTMLERAIAVEPDQAAFLDSYAWILYLQQEYRAALQAIERSLSLDAEPSAEVLEHYFRILKALDDPRAGEAEARYLRKQEAEQGADAGKTEKQPER